MRERRSGTCRPPSVEATARRIGATGAHATEASVAVATSAADWGTSPVTAQARRAEVEHVVRETGEAAGDPPWVPGGDLEQNW